MKEKGKKSGKKRRKQKVLIFSTKSSDFHQNIKTMGHTINFHTGGLTFVGGGDGLIEF